MNDEPKSKQPGVYWCVWKPCHGVLSLKLRLGDDGLFRTHRGRVVPHSDIGDVERID